MLLTMVVSETIVVLLYGVSALTLWIPQHRESFWLTLELDQFGIIDYRATTGTSITHYVYSSSIQQSPLSE